MIGFINFKAYGGRGREKGSESKFVFRNAPRGFKKTPIRVTSWFNPQLTRKVLGMLVAGLEGNTLSVEAFYLGVQASRGNLYVVFHLGVQASRGNLYAVFCLHTCTKGSALMELPPQLVLDRSGDVDSRSK